MKVVITTKIGRPKLKCLKPLTTVNVLRKGCVELNKEKKKLMRGSAISQLFVNSSTVFSEVVGMSLFCSSCSLNFDLISCLTLFTRL